MKHGDVIESSIWLDGHETAEQLLAHKNLIAEAIEDVCAEQGFQHGPVLFIEKKPGAERVPPVPDHIAGPNVRLLVAESAITQRAPAVSKTSFVDNLDAVDLTRLRILTRRAHAKYHPKDTLTDAQCDAVIEELGPRAALATLRYGVDGKLIS